MGKDVIIILIIILSYKILMKYSKVIEGVNNDEETDPNQGFLKDIFMKAIDGMDRLAQYSADTLISPICSITMTSYDGVSRQCITIDPTTRPEKCNPLSQSGSVNCKQTYYNPYIDCNTFSKEECNNDINCRYSDITSKCEINTHLCSFKEDICDQKNFSRDKSAIKALVNLYKDNTNEVSLMEFIKAPESFTSDLPLEIDFPNMIQFYNQNPGYQALQNVTGDLSVINIDILDNEFQELFVTVNITPYEIIKNYLTSTTETEYTLAGFINNLLTAIQGLDPTTVGAGTGAQGTGTQDAPADDEVGAQRTDGAQGTDGAQDAPADDEVGEAHHLKPGNQKIYANIFNILLYLYFYYEKRKDNAGNSLINSCVDDDNLCKIDNDKCIINNSSTDYCDNKLGPECLIDPYCEIKSGWVICEPGKKFSILIVLTLLMMNIPVCMTRMDNL